MAVDPTTGDVYIADYNNYEVEKVTPQGTLSVFAGTGQYGPPEPGPATSSPLGGPVQDGSTTIESGPTGVAVDPTTGDVYIADPANDVIEMVTPAGQLSIAAGTIDTPGTPSNGELNSPYGVAVDSSGDLFIADYGNADVEEVSSSNPGTPSVVAGTGTSGTPTNGAATTVDLNAPTGVAVDDAGELYIADPYANVVEKVASGNLTIFAGTGAAGTPESGAAANSTDLTFPSGVAVDPDGDVYVAAYGDNEIDQVSPTGTLSVFAGTGTAGPPTAGLATSSELDNPFGVAFNSGDLYIADTSNNEIEQIGPWTAPANSTPPSISGTPQQGQTLTTTDGTWSNSPTGYGYQWEDCSSANCTAISGATGSSYTLTGTDVGHTIEVVVTASNPGGSATGTSAATTAVSAAPTTTTTAPTTTTITAPTTTTPAPEPSTAVGAACPSASGSVTGSRLGMIVLGTTRTQVRKALPRYTTSGTRSDRFCLAGGPGLLAYYPSAALLKTLNAGQRARLKDRVVLVLTANHHYTLDHITAGTRVSTVRSRLTHATQFKIGGTSWYVLHSASATKVLEVKHGTIEEVGIADPAITASNAAQRRLLTSR